MVAGILPEGGIVMDEDGIDRARLRAREWREKRHLLNRNEGLGDLRRLSEEELQERDDTVALQMENLAPSMNYPIRIAAYRAELMRREGQPQPNLRASTQPLPEQLREEVVEEQAFD